MGEPLVLTSDAAIDFARDLIRNVLWAKAHVLIRGGYRTRPAWRFLRACEAFGIPIPENLRRLARGHYEEPDLEPEQPPRQADMDGDEHTTARDCCTILGRTCQKCGGFVHVQPVYGALAELCEGCPEDAHYWHGRRATDPSR